MRLRALLLVLALLLITIEPSHVLWGVIPAYGVSGYAGSYTHLTLPTNREV